MEQYPQEYVGRTLLEVNQPDEMRRVYLRDWPTHVEVAEFTQGDLTQSLYDAPVHLHCVQLDSKQQDLCGMGVCEYLGRDAPDREQTLDDVLRAYFSRGNYQLVDLMDLLDQLRVPYGYLNTLVGSHVSYRPARSR